MSCPMCNSKTKPEYRPFCSKRCADLDLGKWLNASYRVATDEAANVDEGAPATMAEPPLFH